MSRFAELGDARFVTLHARSFGTKVPQDDPEFVFRKIRLNITDFIIVSVIKTVLALFILLTAVAYTVWLERKVVGHMQNRWGPTRVGPFGLLQPLADGVKFLFKEDLTPPHVYKPLYIAAPMIAVVFALTSIAVVPVGNWIKIGGLHIPLQITDVNIGLLIILGVTSLGS